MRATLYLRTSRRGEAHEGPLTGFAPENTQKLELSIGASNHIGMRAQINRELANGGKARARFERAAHYVEPYTVRDLPVQRLVATGIQVDRESPRKLGILRIKHNSADLSRRTISQPVRPDQSRKNWRARALVPPPSKGAAPPPPGTPSRWFVDFTGLQNASLAKPDVRRQHPPTHSNRCSINGEKSMTTKVEDGGVEFAGFVAGVAATALATLKGIDHLPPGGGKGSTEAVESSSPEPRATDIRQGLATARQLIDTLIMLEEKTKGNLTPDEQRFLHDVLNDLRITYVRVSDKTHREAKG